MFFKRNIFIVAMVLISKLFIMTVFSFWLFNMRNVDRLPMMADQSMYITDINMIRNDAASVLEPDSKYQSHNTLYSRTAGLAGWLLQFFSLPPLFGAIMINALAQFIVAIYTTKLYIMAKGRHPIIFFIVMNYSPCLTAYSFFALRDLFILAFFSMFIFYAFSSRYVSSILISCVFVVLRKFFIIFDMILLVLRVVINRMLKKENKILPIFTYSIAAVVVLYSVLTTMDLGWVAEAISRHTPTSVLVAAVGLAKFFPESNEEGGQVTKASPEAGKTARILMFDSIVIPVLAVISLFYLMKRGTLLQKEMAVLSVAIALGLSIAYLGIQGNFPMRKLLCDIPLMYAVVFLAFETYRDRKKSTVGLGVPV